MLYFKIPISRDASQWESLPLKAGGKAKTWIKGLKKLSDNKNKIILFSLTGQHFIATSPCVSGSISVKFVYVYNCILSSLYTKGANFIQDPAYQGTVFKQQPVFPLRSKHFPERGRRGFAFMQKIKHHVNISVNLYHPNLFSLMSSSLTLNEVSLTCLDQAIVSFRIW